MTGQKTITQAAIAIRDAIDANPLSKKTSAQLCAQFHTDRNKVLPDFRELTGLTIKGYQLKRMMLTARDMLLTGMTVKEAAIECGYSSYSNNFTRSFRKAFNMSPEEWLRQQAVTKENSGGK